MVNLCLALGEDWVKETAKPLLYDMLKLSPNASELILKEKTMPHMKIVSEGTDQTTKVLIDGKSISGVTQIEIEPICANSGQVKVSLKLELTALDLNIGDLNISLDDIFINSRIKDALLSE